MALANPVGQLVGGAASTRSGGGQRRNGHANLHAPQAAPHGGGPRFQQCGNEQAEAASLDADRLQGGTRRRRQAHRLRRQGSGRANSLVSRCPAVRGNRAARFPCWPRPAGVPGRGRSVRRGRLQLRAQALALGTVKELAVQHLNGRPQCAAPAFERAIGAPSQVTAWSSSKCQAASGAASRRRRGAASPSARLAVQRAARVFFSPLRERVGEEAEPLDPADAWPSTTISPRRVTAESSVRPRRPRVGASAARQRRSTKRLGRRSCRASDSRSSTSRALSPASAARPHPVGARGDVGPYADTGEPLHQRVDVAVRAGKRADLPGQPVGRQVPSRGDMAEYPGAQPGVRLVRELAELGYLTGFPQPADRRAPLGEAAYLGLVRQCGESLEVRGVVAFHQSGPGGGAISAGQQRIEHGRSRDRCCASRAGPAAQSCGPPQRPAHLVAERRAFARGAERPVAHAASGAAGDLRHLGRGQRRGRWPSNLPRAAKAT